MTEIRLRYHADDSTYGNVHCYYEAQYVPPGSRCRVHIETIGTDLVPKKQEKIDEARAVERKKLEAELLRQGLSQEDIDTAFRERKWAY